MSGNAFRTDIYPTSELGPFARRNAAVYVLDPPLLSEDGVSTHVIVAAAANRVDVFPAEGDGRLASWDGPEFLGGLDHAQVLRALGYELVAVTNDNA